MLSSALISRGICIGCILGLSDKVARIQRSCNTTNFTPAPITEAK